MTLKPILIDAGSAENGYTRLLGGPPQSVSMRSGKIILQPGETVGRHSTDKKEELIIILEGEGQFLFGENAPGFTGRMALYSAIFATAWRRSIYLSLLYFPWTPGEDFRFIASADLSPDTNYCSYLSFIRVI